MSDFRNPRERRSRSTVVRKHSRRLSSGKTTNVVRHHRNLKELQPPTPTEYDSVEELIGENALDQGSWINLDPRYPNTKGIHPDRIDEFIANFPDKRDGKGQKNWDRLKTMGEMNAPFINRKEAIKELIEQGFTKDDIAEAISRIKFYDRDELFDNCQEIHENMKKEWSGEQKRDIKFMDDKFKKIESNDEIQRDVAKAFDDIWRTEKPDIHKDKYTINQLLDKKLDSFVTSECDLDSAQHLLSTANGYNHGIALSLLERYSKSEKKDKLIQDLAKEYLGNKDKKMTDKDLTILIKYALEDNSKVYKQNIYDKKDIRYKSQKIMETMGIGDIEPSSELLELVEEFKYSKNKQKFEKRDLQKIGLRSMKSKAFNTIYDSKITENETIYVTSPRGGHELLSIYAYANEIPKKHIPSDIIHKGEKNFFRHFPESFDFSSNRDGMELKYDMSVGMTFIGNTTGKEIKRVVVVDDVVGSGQQMGQYYEILRKKFPKAQLYYNTVSSRKKEHQSDPYERQFEHYKRKTNTLLEHRGYTGINFRDETIGMSGFRKGLDGTIAVVFPHAIPDGSSDRISRLLIGSKDESMRNVATRGV